MISLPANFYFLTGQNPLLPPIKSNVPPCMGNQGGGGVMDWGRNGGGGGGRKEAFNQIACLFIPLTVQPQVNASICKPLNSSTNGVLPKQLKLLTLPLVMKIF